MALFVINATVDMTGVELSNSIFALVDTGFPARSLTLIDTLSVPSSKLEISTAADVHAPPVIVPVALIALVEPFESSKDTVTTCPSSTSVTVPETCTSPSSVALTLSSTSIGVVTTIAADKSKSIDSVSGALLPATSVTVAEIEIEPS